MFTNVCHGRVIVVDLRRAASAHGDLETAIGSDGNVVLELLRRTV